jgi:hypothetical protein
VIKVGGRVKIHKPTVHSELEGKTGTVKRIDESMAVNEGTALVKLDAGSTVSCRLNELKEVEETTPRKQD